MLRCTICCRCFGIPEWCPNAKMYKLLPVLWSRSGGPMLTCTVCCRCFGLAKIYDLLPLLCRSGAPMLRCTICCRCFGLEAVPQGQDARFNANTYDLLPLLSFRSGSAMLRYNLLFLWSRSGAAMLRCTICCCFGLEVVSHFQNLVAFALVSKWCPNAETYDLLPLLWSRSGAPMLRCTICCRCFGLEVVPRF